MSKLSLGVEKAAKLATQPTGPADLRAAKRLAELEAVIDRGLTSFVEVGEALLEVRDSRLYRVGYETFEAYCKGRWGFTDRRARQLMDATEAVKALPTGTMVPVSERAAREIAPIVASAGPAAAAEVMAEASKDGPPTAAKIREAVHDYIEDMPEAIAAEEREFRVRARWSKHIHQGTTLLVGLRPSEVVPLLDANERQDTEELLPMVEDWLARTRAALADTSRLRVIGGTE